MKPLVLLIISIVTFMYVFSDSSMHGKVSPDFPTTELLQEMHDLASEKTRLRLKIRYYKYQIENNPKTVKKSQSEIQKIEDRLNKIADRFNNIYKNELGKLERVAINAGTKNSEEPKYGVGSYGIIMSATAIEDIAKEELLLFHAGDVFRSKGDFGPLETTGQGWYFRPAKEIKKGTRFVVSCIQNAPEEIENVKNGFMPDSPRARNPNRPYQTNTFITTR